MLEVMMGRHPGDLISSGSDMVLMDVIDQRLSPSAGQTAQEVVFALTIALACIHTNPNARPNMGLVAQELTALMQAQAYVPGLLGTIKIS